MATDILLGADGDLDLTGGSAKLVTGNDQLVQGLTIAMQHFQGDWFLDLLSGIPYIPSIIRKGINESDVYQIYFDALSAKSGVASVDSLEVTISASLRRTSVVATVTPVGEVEPVEITAVSSLLPTG